LIGLMAPKYIISNPGCIKTGNPSITLSKHSFNTYCHERYSVLYRLTFFMIRYDKIR
jgi:hypothetical protein